MQKYYVTSYQNDLITQNEILTNKIKVITKKKKKKEYQTIFFQEINNLLEKELIKALSYYFQKYHLHKNSHLFIVGLGKDYHTPDSVGPNVLKNIHVNAFLENLNLTLKTPKVSSLKPGVLGETGILTEKTIKSITKEIKPDLVILIDSFVTDNINYLNHTIELNNHGLNPGSGLFGITSIISQKSIHCPVVVIGVPTSLLIKVNNSQTAYLLSTKDILEYVQKISKIIGQSLNKAIKKLV